MNRCTARFLAALAPLALVAASAFAQTAEPPRQVREFPKEALRGELTVLAPPDITLNGKPARLSPGSRIRDINNHLVLSAALANQKHTVNYIADNMGQLHQAWILTPEEIKLKRPGMKESWFDFSSDDTPKPLPNGTAYKDMPAFKK